MSSEKARALLDQELKRLETRVQELVNKVGKLDGDNQTLRERLESLTAERANLLAKNDEVRGRVEAMISRLKSLEESA
ncbi:MAG TPA: TIGR02449 family protein [Gammaproteobacteria bacterium]|nr:TIGR02449 family protein [Gammaproteobacteria bacterium]